MDRLPQEVITIIVKYLCRKSRSRALTVNLKFQAEIERISGEFETFVLSNRNAEYFLDLYSGERARYLKAVHFILDLPELPIRSTWAPWLRTYTQPHISEADTRQFDLRFTRQIFFLFSTLKTLESCASEQGITAKFRLVVRDKKRQERWGPECRRLFSGSIHLLSPGALPELTSVNSLDFKFCWITHDCTFLTISLREDCSPLRMIDFRVVLDISAKLPNLKRLSFAADAMNTYIAPIAAVPRRDDPSSSTEDLRALLLNSLRDSRRQFSVAIATGILFPKLADVQWNFVSPYILHMAHEQDVPNPEVIEPLIPDPFSASIRLLSYPLRRMYLSAVIDETLFSPPAGSVPHWPNLESIIVKFPIMTPSGSWYFRGLERREDCKGGHRWGSDEFLGDVVPFDVMEEDWHRRRFRIVPKYDVLGPVLTAFAKATEHMPSLVEAAIWCPLRFDTRQVGKYCWLPPDWTGWPWKVWRYHIVDWAWGIAYTKPHWRAFDTSSGEHNSKTRQIWWKIGPWDIDPEIREQVQQIGRQKHGDALLEHWGSTRTRQGAHLPDPEVFEDFHRRVFE